MILARVLTRFDKLLAREIWRSSSRTLRVIPIFLALRIESILLTYELYVNLFSGHKYAKGIPSPACLVAISLLLFRTCDKHLLLLADHATK